MAKPKRRTSGPTKTYDERIATGKQPVFVWLTPAGHAALESLVAAGMTKTEAVEAGLLAIAEEEAEKPTRGDVAVRDGSPADLAERVRARGARRQAVEVATGEVTKDGGRSRASR